MWQAVRHHDRARFDVRFYSLSRVRDDWTERFVAVGRRLRGARRTLRARGGRADRGRRSRPARRPVRPHQGRQARHPGAEAGARAGHARRERGQRRPRDGGLQAHRPLRRPAGQPGLPDRAAAADGRLRLSVPPRRAGRDAPVHPAGARACDGCDRDRRVRDADEAVAPLPRALARRARARCHARASPSRPRTPRCGRCSSACARPRASPASASCSCRRDATTPRTRHATRSSTSCSTRCRSAASTACWSRSTPACRSSRSSARGTASAARTRSSPTSASPRPSRETGREYVDIAVRLAEDAAFAADVRAAIRAGIAAFAAHRCGRTHARTRSGVRRGTVPCGARRPCARPRVPDPRLAGIESQLRAGDARGALGVADALIANPALAGGDRFAALMLRSRIHEALGNLPAAIADVEGALALNPRDARGYNELGILLRRRARGGPRDRRVPARDRARSGLRARVEQPRQRAARERPPRRGGERLRARDDGRPALPARVGEPRRRAPRSRPRRRRRGGVRARDRARPEAAARADRVGGTAARAGPHRRGGDALRARARGRAARRQRLAALRRHARRARRPRGRARAPTPRRSDATRACCARSSAATWRLPMVPAGADDVARSRQRYAAGLAAIEAELPDRAARLSAAALVDELRWTNFLLAYQGEDDRELQARFAGVVARAIDAADPALRAPLPHRYRGSAATARRLRLGVLPRRHGGPLLRALDHRPAARGLRGVRLSPAARRGRGCRAARRARRPVPALPALPPVAGRPPRCARTRPTCSSIRSSAWTRRRSRSRRCGSRRCSARRGGIR